MVLSISSALRKVPAQTEMRIRHSMYIIRSASFRSEKSVYVLIMRAQKFRSVKEDGEQ